MTSTLRHGAWAGAILVAIAMPFILPTSFAVHIAILALLFAFLGTAWNLLGGYAGQHSFGHALFLGVGAYVTVMLPLHAGINPWVAMLIGGVAAVGVGAVVGVISFRYEIRGAFFLLVTIAFAEMAYLVVVNVRVLGGASGVVVPPSDSQWLDFQFRAKGFYYYVILIMLALVLTFIWAVRNRRFGLYLRAIRENEDAARALGINAFRWKLLACCVSAGCTGLAGGFYAQYYLFVDPAATFGLTLSVQIAIVAIVGGLGTLAGPAIGAILLIPATEMIRLTVGVNVPGIHLVIYGAVLIAVILWMPEGLVGGVPKLVRRFAGVRQHGPTSAIDAQIEPEHPEAVREDVRP